MWNTSKLARRSLEVITEHQAPTGAYPASPSFPPYRYCWFRDGAFVADAMSRWGEIESAEAFFAWCSAVVVARGGKNLHPRYTLDGQEAGEQWPTFQLDGFGLWPWALAEHAARHRRSVEPFQEAVQLTLAFLARNWRAESTDWWEEREGLHPATLACIYAGLAAWDHEEAEPVRSTLLDLDEPRLDASLLVLATPFALRPELAARVEDGLVSPGGGVHRHPADTYYGGGEWLLLTALLGWHYAESGRTAEARAKLAWLVDHATPEGHLPEQSQDHLLAPDALPRWLEKWGPPASPLLWSHAMFLTLARVV